MQATYCLEDNKLRLYPIEKLDEETRERAKKLGFKWARGQELYVAPAWSTQRYDFLIELCEVVEEEQISPQERARDRAERFSQYSEKRSQESDQCHKQGNAIASNIPFGQPVLVGHHSEKRHRRDIQRMRDKADKSVKLMRTAEYWKDRAKYVLQHSNAKNSPTTRTNRIKRLKADYRAFERNRKQAEDSLIFMQDSSHSLEEMVSFLYERVKFAMIEKLESGELTQNEVRLLCLDCYASCIKHYNRWIDHTAMRIDYEENVLQAQLANQDDN